MTTDHNEAMRLADEVRAVADRLQYTPGGFYGVETIGPLNEAAALLRKQATARALDTFAHNVLAGQARLQMVQLENKLRNLTTERDTLRAEVERLRVDGERWGKFIGLSYQVRAEWAANLSLVPVLTSWVDRLPAIDTARKATP